MRVERFEASATAVAGEVLAITIHFPRRLRARVIDAGNVHYALAQIERGLYRFRDSAALILAHDQTIHHDLDEMLAAMVDARRFADVVRFAIDAHTHEAAAANLLEDRFVFLLAAPFVGSREIRLRPFRQIQDFFDDLVRGLRADRNFAIGAVRLAESRRTRYVDNRRSPVTVPTIRRGLLLVVCCSMLIAGDRPLTCSTLGFWIWPRNWRA